MLVFRNTTPAFFLQRRDPRKSRRMADRYSAAYRCNAYHFAPMFAYTHHNTHHWRMEKSPDHRFQTAKPSPAERPAATRSRLTNGSELLPGTDARSTWARLFKDVVLNLETHCGGELTEVERMTARRTAALEVELCHLEAEFAQRRAAGQAPDAAALDLYSRLAGGQRRHLEALGMQRRAKELTPSLGEYLRGKSE